MELSYSKSYEERAKANATFEYLDSLGTGKKFYLKYIPPVLKLFGRNYFLAFLLITVLQA